MSEGFANSIIGGAATLIRAAMQSTDFLTGVRGWKLSKNGSFEAQNATIRGTITAGTFNGTNYIINSSGAFFYSGTPAAGNMVVSIAPVAGTDGFGNKYAAEIVTYQPGVNAVQLNTAGVQFLSWSGSAWITDGSLVEATPSPSGVGSTAALTGLPLYVPNGFYGQMTAIKPGATNPPVAETWHPMTLLNGWTIQASAYARYKLLPTNEVWVQAKLVAGTLTNGTVIWNPPARYVPTLATAQTALVTIETGASAAGALSAYVSINSTSNLQVQNLPSGLVNCSLNFRYALD